MQLFSSAPRRRFLTSLCAFGCLLLNAIQTPAPRLPKTGTIVGQVLKRKINPTDSDSPLDGANVRVPYASDKDGKQLWKDHATADQNGNYRFDWEEGVTKLSLDKSPFWDPKIRDKVYVKPDKDTDSEKTYLDPNQRSVSMVRTARSNFLLGDKEEAERSLKELANICLDIENTECLLVARASKELSAGEFASARRSIVNLASMLPTGSVFTFQPGQSMYIVAFRTRPMSMITNSTDKSRRGEYVDHALDIELRIRKRIEEWKVFKVVEKPSDADFVFLVNLDESSMEGLVLPLEGYTRNFTQTFDLDALRESAYGRYLAGPLKIATVKRLSDRLLKRFRLEVHGP